MSAANGILTARGGMTSHAAVVCRGMGKVCVCGSGDITEIDDEHDKFMIVGGKKYVEGDVITLDGTSGLFYAGALKLVDADIESGNLKEFMEMADRNRKLLIRTNADTPNDSKVAISFGA